MAFLCDEAQPVRAFKHLGAPETDDTVGQPDERSAKRRTVLVVDDDESLRQTMVEILRTASYSVSEAGDGDEALRVLGRQPVDVVILDLHMPGRDGLSVLESLRAPPPKVVVLSAFAYYAPEDINRMVSAGTVSRVLQKPCPPPQLLAAVNNAIAELRHED